MNPVLCACAAGGPQRSAGTAFVAKLLEGTGSEASSSRRGGTLAQTVRGAPASPEPGPAESLTASTNPRWWSEAKSARPAGWWREGCSLSSWGNTPTLA